ncbi:MAG: hypothetical protein AABY22_09795 [Nanoarchaeota archaeon]
MTETQIAKKLWKGCQRSYAISPFPEYCGNMGNDIRLICEECRAKTQQHFEDCLRFLKYLEGRIRNFIVKDLESAIKIHKKNGLDIPIGNDGRAGSKKSIAFSYPDIKIR